jgi:23S rRNA-/tRNA-specific pseudouridylate synthase
MAEGSTFQRAVRPDGQSAHTDYETIAVNERFTLLRLVPQNGANSSVEAAHAAIG